VPNLYSVTVDDVLPSVFFGLLIVFGPKLEAIPDTAVRLHNKRPIVPHCMSLGGPGSNWDGPVRISI
jgi:hypothetical protein